MSNNNINDASKHQREMKTPIQEAIEKVQSLRQIDAVINPIGVIESILSSMLEKEIDVFEEIIDIIDSENSGLSAEQRLDEISRLIKTFNTKER